MKRISQWFLVLGLVAALAVSACAAPKSPAPAPGQPAAPTAANTREQKLIEAAKANGETEVVLWTMTWYQGAVEEAFEAKYPFLKLTVWDGSSKVEPKIREEYKAGQYTPDVMQLAIRRLVRLHKVGNILGEYEWPNVVDWPYQPDHNFWRVHQTSLGIPMYNTDMVSPADAPKTWEDLNDLKWRGKAIISSSLASYPLSHAYLLGDVTKDGIKWDRTVNFWKEVVQTTKPSIGRGFKAPLEKLVTGDVSIMLLSVGTDGLKRILNKEPIAFVPVKKVIGTPWGLTLPKNPPHPNAARLLLDFLTSEEGALIHANMSPAPTFHPRAAKRAYPAKYFEDLGMEWSVIPEGLVADEDYVTASNYWVEEILGIKR